MVENLRLGNASSMVLTNSNTDITAATWTLPAASTVMQDKTSAEILLGNTTSGGSIYKDEYGNYYNKAAATAESWSGNGIAGEAPSSICPKNWRLPINSAPISASSANKSFQRLFFLYGSAVSTIITSPLDFNFSGRARGKGYSTLYEINVYGYFQTSTATTGGACVTYYTYDGTNSSACFSWYYTTLLPVRCVSR